MPLMQMQAQGFTRVSKTSPCPVCGKGDWCGVTGEIAVCMRVQSAYPAQNGGWVHRLSGAAAGKQFSAKATAQSLSLPDERLAKAYQAFLAQLSLSGRHRTALLSRGMSEGEVGARGYRSVPGPRQAFPLDLEGVPGFTRCSGAWRAAAPSGILIPVRDAFSRIVALKIRVDRPLDGCKYCWFSSSRFGGPSPGARVHVSRPLGPVKHPGLVWLVEGPLKADIVSWRLGVVTLGIPGASAWQRVLPELEALGCDRAVIAYDMDMLEKEQVKSQARALKEVLLQKGLTVGVALWDRSCKGPDDALVQGKQIKVIL